LDVVSLTLTQTNQTTTFNNVALPVGCSESESRGILAMATALAGQSDIAEPRLGKHSASISRP